VYHRNNGEPGGIRTHVGISATD